MYLAGNFQSPQANSWRSLRYTVLLFSDSQFSEEYCFKWLKVCEIDNFFSLPVCTADQAGKYPRLLTFFFFFMNQHRFTCHLPFAVEQVFNTTFLFGCRLSNVIVNKSSNFVKSCDYGSRMMIFVLLLFPICISDYFSSTSRAQRY